MENCKTARTRERNGIKLTTMTLRHTDAVMTCATQYLSCCFRTIIPDSGKNPPPTIAYTLHVQYKYNICLQCVITCVINYIWFYGSVLWSMFPEKTVPTGTVRSDVFIHSYTVLMHNMFHLKDK